MPHRPVNFSFHLPGLKYISFRGQTQQNNINNASIPNQSMLSTQWSSVLKYCSVASDWKLSFILKADIFIHTCKTTQANFIFPLGHWSSIFTCQEQNLLASGNWTLVFSCTGWGVRFVFPQAPNPQLQRIFLIQF